MYLEDGAEAKKLSVESYEVQGNEKLDLCQMTAALLVDILQLSPSHNPAVK